MTEQQDLECWVVDQFTELTNYGFSEPVVKRKDFSTDIHWLGTDIALELELDWKEYDAFLLIVRLEDSQLPQRYYMSNGKPCRVHLQKVIKEKAWSVTTDEMKVISTNLKRGHSGKPSAKNLIQRALAYKAVLLSCVNQLLDENRKQPGRVSKGNLPPSFSQNRT